MAKENKTPQDGREISLPSPQVMEIALGKETISTPGAGALEHVIVSSIAQVVFGSNKGVKATTIANLKGAGADGGGLVGTIENSSLKILNKLDEVKKSIDDFSTVTQKTINSLVETPLMIKIVEDAAKPIKKDNEQAKSVLDINFTPENIVESFNALAEMAENDSLASIATSLGDIVILASDFEEINKGISPFIDTLSSLIDKRDGVDILVNFLKGLKAETDVLQEFKKPNIEGFTSFVSGIGDLSQHISNIAQFVTGIIDLDINAEKAKEKIATLDDIANVEINGNIKNFNSLFPPEFTTSMESLIAALPTVNKFVKSINELEKPNLANIDELNEILKYLNKIEFNNNSTIDEHKLVNFVSSLIPICALLSHFDKAFENVNIDNLLNASKSLAIIFANLEKIEFEPSGEINSDWLDELVNSSIITNISLIGDIFNMNKAAFSDEVIKMASNAAYITASLEKMSYQPEAPMTANTLEQLMFLESALGDKDAGLVKMLTFIGVSDFGNSISNIKQLTKSLAELAKFDTTPFIGKDFKEVKMAAKSVETIASAVVKAGTADEKSIDALETFIERVFAKDGVMAKFKEGVAALGLKDSIEDAKNATKVVNEITNACKTTALIGSLAPLLKIGVVALKSYIDELVNIIKKISEIDPKSVKASMNTMGDITKLVVASTIVMLIGAFFIIKNPKLVIGALAFALTLGLFLFTVIGAINLASRGLQTSLDTMKGVSLLVMVSTMVMLIGATFVINFPQLVIGALAFTLLLDLFIWSIIKLINNASKQISFAMGVMKDIALLVTVSTLCLIVGAVFMTEFPELVSGSLEFVGLLDLFIWSILKIVKKQSKGMPLAMAFMKDICYLIATCTLVLIVGGLFMTAYPELVAGAIEFTVLLNTFIWGVLKIINKNSSNIQKAIPNAILFATVVGVSASVLLIGGGLLAAFPELIVTVPLFGTLLAGFTYVMSKILGQLAKNTGNLIKGAAAMAIISGVVLVSASAMVVLRKACEGDMLALLTGAGIMVATLGVVALFAVTMGALASNQFFWFGVGAVAAIGGVVLMAAGAMLIIAKALETFKQVGKFDIGPALGAITGAITIGLALAPFGLLAPFILAASVSVVSLSIAISQISEAVAEAASLKIPIYEGTKKVGYRQLNNKDFDSAAKNVKSVVSCLGGAMIDIYNKHPEMFQFQLIGDNPFVRVVESTSRLSEVISKIAKAVKQYASLTVPLYDDKGKEIGVRNLGKDDFKKASENVKLVITTLGGALINVYNTHPEMFKDTSIFKWLGAKPENTPLARVISVTQRIGKLMSSISKGVHAMGKLLVPDQWDKEGNPIHYVNMGKTEIEQAGINTKFIIETISNSLIELYKNNEEMYKDKSLFSILRLKEETPGNTPLSIVIAVSQKIGKLMSKIAKGVHAMGKLLVPDDWDKEGNPTHFINMSENDIKAAGDNTKHIVETISNSLIELYKNNEEMYKDKSWFSNNPGNTPLSIVLSVSMKIGKLMSSIAKGVHSMGKLMVADQWDKEGNPIHYEKMSDKDIIQSGKNVERIVTSMALSLMSVYQSKPEWFKSTNWLGQSSPDPKASPFATVIALNLKLSKIISSVSKAVGTMAKLMIPDDWDKEGNPKHYVQLGEKDFKLAKENIGDTIVTIGTAIMGIYDKHKEWFTDKDGDLLKSSKSPFGIVMKSVSSMGELVANISKAVKDIATLQIPFDWDSKGAPIKFRQLEKKDFDLVKENIGTIVSTIGESIMDMYAAHEKDGWFKEGGNWLTGKTPSPFTTMMNACVSMGEMISGISSGITAMAQLMIPVKWDNEGNPIEFRQMNDGDFTNASDAIAKVVTCIGQGLIDLYNNDPYDMFKVDEDSEGTIFGRVSESCAYLGTMIKDIAEGVSEMATLEETLKKQGINIDYKAAAENIKAVVTAIGGALLETFNDHKSWFENPPIVNETKVGFGPFSYSKKDVKPDTSDTPFQKVIKSCTLMGGMIINIAEGIAYFATITQKALPDGSKMDIPTATTNIGNIITTIGKAIMSVASGSDFYDIDKLEPIINAVRKSSDAVMSVALLIEKIGMGEIPVVDKDGNIIDKIPLSNETIAKAAETIGNVITGVSAGFALANEKDANSPFSVFSENPRLNNMLDMVNKAIKIVSSNVVTLARISKGEINLWNSDFTKIIETVSFSQDDISKGEKTIGEIISGVAAGLVNAMIDFKSRGWGWWLDGDFNKSELGTLLTAVNFAMDGVAANLRTLVYLAKNKLPIYEFKKTSDGGFGYEIKEWVTFTPDNIKKGATTVGDIISSVAGGLVDAMSNMKGTEFWSLVEGNYENSELGKLMTAINHAMTIVGSNAITLRNLAVGEISIFNKDGKEIRTINFKPSDLTSGAQTISTIIETIARGISNATIAAFGLFGADEWEKTKAYTMLKAVEAAKDTVGSMALFLSHLGNNEYTYYDTRLKRLNTISFKSQDNLREAAKTIGVILESIASGVAQATSSVSTYFGEDAIMKYESSKPYFALEAIKQAKDSIGPFALLLSHLANNEYTYYDFIAKKEKTVSFGSKDELKVAGETIGSIISAIGAGVGLAVNAISESIGDDAVLGRYENTKAHFALLALEQAKDAIGPFALFLAKLASGQFEYYDFITKTEKSIPIDISSLEETGNSIGKLITVLSSSIAKAADDMGNVGWDIFGFGKSSEDKISAMFNSLNKAIPFLGRIAKVISLYSANKATIVENGVETIVDVMDVTTASFNIAMIMQSIPKALQEASKEFDKIGDPEKTIGYLNNSYFMLTQLMKSVELIASENASEMLSKLPEKAFSTILNPVIEDISLVMKSIEKLGENKELFGNLAQGPTPIEKFAKDVAALQMQGMLLQTSNIHEEYRELADSLGYAVEKINTLQLPETTVKQIGDVSKFVRSMNRINIEGVESFTKLIEQLNKMGINMGNLDKLANAIANKLAPTLKQAGKQMDDLRKELVKDEARKTKHKKEIENSVEMIQKAMSSTMQVVVSMEDSGSDISASGGMTDNTTQGDGGTKSTETDSGKYFQPKNNN